MGIEHVIGFGAFALAVLNYMHGKGQKKKRLATWLLVAVGIAAIGVSFVRNDSAPSVGHPAQQASVSGSHAGRDLIAPNQTSAGPNSPNIVASEVKLTYIFVDSSDAEPIRAALEQKRDALRVRLMERYPYGLTMIGIRGAQFTTLDDENGLFRVDTKQSSLRIDREKQTFRFEARIVKAKEVAETQGFDAGTIFGFQPLSETNRFDVPFSLAGVSISTELVSSKPGEEILVVGFKPADLRAFDINAAAQEFQKKQERIEKRNEP